MSRVCTLQETLPPHNALAYRRVITQSCMSRSGHRPRQHEQVRARSVAVRPIRSPLVSSQGSGVKSPSIAAPNEYPRPEMVQGVFLDLCQYYHVLGACASPRRRGWSHRPKMPNSCIARARVTSNRSLANSFDTRCRPGSNRCPCIERQQPAPTTSFAANPNSASGPGGGLNGSRRPYALARSIGSRSPPHRGSPARKPSRLSRERLPGPVAEFSRMPKYFAVDTTLRRNVAQTGINSDKKRHRSGNVRARQSPPIRSGGRDSIAKPAFRNAATHPSLTPSRIADEIRQPGCIPVRAGPPAGGFTCLSNMLHRLVDGIPRDSRCHQPLRHPQRSPTGISARNSPARVRAPHAAPAIPAR